MMRILVEPSDYTLFNIGDTAMLQTAVKRLKALFPNAVIEVFTEDSQGLAFYCPEATPIPTAGRTTWLEDHNIFFPLYKYLSDSWTGKHLSDFERKFRRRWPSMAKSIIQFSLRRRGRTATDLNHYLKAISEADLLVVSGMGGITDAFLEYAFGVLDTLALAIHCGVPTVMFGQGIGPIKNRVLFVRAKEVLPKIDLISLREGRAGLPLLKSFGVSPEHVLVTGDDAIELAYLARPRQLGKALGVNLRAANYSQVDQTYVERIRLILQNFGRLNNAPLVPIPISRVPGEEDLITIQQLVTGYPDVIGIQDDFDTQSKVLKQVQLCRVVITGSYHAAVFALAMGIPTVCLAKSEYYIDKFLGLAELFQTGCQVVFLDDPQMAARLQDAIQKMWESAEQVRPDLLKAAEDQIKWSQAAYQRLHEIMDYKSGVQKVLEDFHSLE